MKVVMLPAVAAVEGVRLEPGSPGDPTTMRVCVQYTDPAKTWHELQLTPFDAMYLLQMLEQLAAATGLQRLPPPARSGH